MTFCGLGDEEFNERIARIKKKIKDQKEIDELLEKRENILIELS